VRALLLLLLVGCHKAPFAERVAARLKARLPGASVTQRDPATLLIKQGDRPELVSSLDNLKRECEAHPEDCDSAIDRFANTYSQAEQPDRREEVRAVLKDAHFLAMAQEQMARSPKAAENAILSRPLAGDLSIIFVIDKQDSTKFINQSMMQKLGLTPDELHKLAMANLKTALPTLPHQALEGSPRVFLVAAGDDYEASRMLIDDLWTAAAKEVEGDLIAAAPCRHRVLFTGSKHPEDVAMLRTLAEKLSETEHHPLTKTLFKRTPQGWVAIQ
jgi:uncharacterized protein YtpQ (UPF0354 family)